MKLFWRRETSHTLKTWHKKGMLALLIALLLTFVLQTVFSNSAFAQSATNTTNHVHRHYTVQDPNGTTSNIISDETIQTTSSEQIAQLTLHVSDVHNNTLEDIHATVTDHVQGHGEASVTLALNDQDIEEHTSFQGETTVNDVFASPNPGQPTLSDIHSYGGFNNVAQQGYDPQHRLVRVARTHAQSLWFHVGINPTLDGDWDQFRDAVTEYIQAYRSFLQSASIQVFASLLIGVAIGTVDWEAWQKAVPHHFEWQTIISFFIIGTTFQYAAGLQGVYNYWKKMRDAQEKAEGLIQSMRFRQGPPPPPPGGTGGYHIELR